MLNTKRSAGAPSVLSAIALSNRAITSASLVPSTTTGVAPPPAALIASATFSILAAVRPATST
jgi:hypothetical protein